MTSLSYDTLPEGFVVQQQGSDTLPEGFIVKPKAYYDRNLSISDFYNPEASYGRTDLDYGLKGLTLGLGNKLANVGGAAIASAVTGEPISDLLTSANQMQSDRMNQELLSNPKSAIGSEIVGGLIGGGALGETEAGQALTNSIGSGLAPNATGFIGKTGNALTKMALSGATGAATGAISGAAGAAPGNALEGAREGANNGAILGAAAIPIAASLSAAKNALIPTVSDFTKNLAQKAIEDFGIPLTRAQIGNSTAAKTIASAANKLPFSGGDAFQATQQKAFNKAVLSEIGVNSDTVTPQAVKEGYDKITNGFNTALKGQKITISDNALNKLSDIDNRAFDELTPDAYAHVKNQIDKFLGSAGNDYTVPGEKMGNFRSKFSRMSRTGGEVAPFFSELKNFVQDASVEGAPARKEVLQDSIQKYRNYQILEPLLEKGTINGDIPASQLFSKVASNYSDFARGGGGKLGELARIGQAFLKDPIPDSGTAQRNLIYRGLEGLGATAAGGGYAAGGVAAAVPSALAAVAAPIGAARIYNTINTSQPLVQKALTSNGQALANKYLPLILAGQNLLPLGGQ